ncbi:hypothetical protein [Agarivorans aestuarii]|uniref:hypothetical protein n=1 Tax=Agarivorans aestuarii TaxID=1563703 RepID=UPI001C806FFB|nr:hypothetical protein [Agarivorans aestuarii]
MTTFKASTQYNDWNGSIAADDNESDFLLEHLRKKGLIADRDVIVGAEFTYIDTDKVIIECLVMQLEKGQSLQNVLAANATLRLKKRQLEVSLLQFFSFFRRLNITLSSFGELEGSRYIVE